MPANEKDIATILQLKQDFYANSQAIIEKHYLQPLIKDNNGCDLPAKTKDNLQDGVLERLVHGGMHVGRAQFWVLVLHQALKTVLPDEIQKSLAYFSARLGLSEEQIITLIRYAVLFHDSARQHEAEDEWDKESAQKAKAFFEAQGLSTEIADVFSQAAALKDKPEEFGKLFPDYQYIRQLIYLADCFEIMRCTSHFKLGRALKVFTADKHEALTPVFINMAKQMHQLLCAQADMLYPCVIVLPDDQEINLNDGKNHFSVSKKIAFEHADNVCAVLCASIKAHTQFSLYLADETHPSSEQAAVTPAFNPFIHGTNSSIFSLLKRTKGKIMPTLHLLEAGIAPMTGEIEGLWGGGIASNLYARSPICFGRLDCDGQNVYNLNRVYRYAQRNIDTKYQESVDTTRYYCKKYIDNSLERSYEKLNGVLVYVGRAKQLGIEAFESKSYETFKTELNTMIQLYYLYLLMGKHIHPGFNIASIKDDECLVDNVTSSFYAHFTYEKLIQKIIEKNINIQEIYENPTTESLQRILDLLRFPEQATIGTGLASLEQKTVTLNEEHRQMFSLSQSSWETEVAYEYDFRDMQDLLAPKNYKETHIFLSRFQQKKIKIDHVVFEKIVLSRIAKLREKMATLDRIYLADSDDARLTPRESCFLTNPFPVILVCSEKTEEKIHLCTFAEQEYRAYEVLQLGDDIDMIATDTVEHQHIIMTFLNENNINNVQVILIAQLEQSLIDHQKPHNMPTNATIIRSIATMSVAADVTMSNSNAAPCDSTGLNASFN